MPRLYAWVIDKDLLAERWSDIKSRAGVNGPGNADPTLLARLAAGEGDKFRMLDDDDEVYYEGRIVGDNYGYEPLEDFGEGDAGCTQIQYRSRNGRRWENL